MTSEPGGLLFGCSKDTPPDMFEGPPGGSLGGPLGRKLPLLVSPDDEVFVEGCVGLPPGEDDREDLDDLYSFVKE